MTPLFEQCVGDMAVDPHWFLWRLEWDATQGKFKKTPCALDGSMYRIDASLPENRHFYIDAVTALGKLPITAELRYALGYWLTPESGYWFLDIDKCVDGDGQLLPFASQMVGAYPGAFMEWSSSGKGLHVIGRGAVPPHRTRPERDVASRLLPLQLEFYTADRGIAFGLDGVAQGSADTEFAMQPLVDQYFPARAESAGGDGARPEWRGPTDDAVLIERMLGARLSAEAAFGGKPSLPQLWRGECEHNSENDMALASHLAFWTGCDEERMLRLMLRSGMVRDKWREHRTYLTLTIGNACANCENVYQEPERNLAVQQEMYATTTVAASANERIPAEMFDKVEELLAMVSACGTERELHNDVMPIIQQAGIPVALQERIVTEVKDKLNFWKNKIPIGKLRATLFPPALRTDVAAELPEWAKHYCFVANGDRFFNLNNAQYMTMVGFQAVYGRFMPIVDSGRRENAAEKCLHFWQMPIVEQVGYRPDCGPYYEWDGVSYANLYSPTSVPAVSPYTPEGLAGIEQFQMLLYDMCGRRDDVFRNLLYWYAHNVQRPGVKIRWAPIIKGVHGDGKTLSVMVLRSAMGHRNVNFTSNSNISNSGGFTDWAVRGAVNVIEEIMLTGKQRHQLYNAMKEFISNNICDVNPKGGKPYQSFNCTNHAANTNHNDAIPMEATDRRWFVIFTPWSDLAAMLRYCGLTAAQWKARTDAIDYAKNNCGGEFRAWLMGIEIPPEFDINGSAMMTPEKKRMMASSVDDAETAAAAIIADGALGVTERALSSSMLSVQLAYRANQEAFDVPQKVALNHMLTRLGYSKMDKQIKWNGRTHTIWLKNGVELDNDEIRLILDKSNPNQTSNQT